MKKGQHLQLQIILFIAALSLGQFASLLHAVEHPFHDSNKSCQVYYAIEQSENALISGCPVIEQPGFQFEQPIESYPFQIGVIQKNYRIRAPPSAISRS